MNKVKIRIACGRYDCSYYWKGGCSLPFIAIGKDCKCNSFHRTNTKEVVNNFDNDIKDVFTNHTVSKEGE